MSTEPSPPYDICMRGFTSRSPVDTALTWIDQHAKTLETETIDLHTAYGRMLARELFAPMDIPTLDRSAVDGYALRGAETAGAGSYNPLPFVLQGEVLPERPFQGLIQTGAAVRIMAGSSIPEGADAVLPADYAEEIAGQVAVTTTVAPGDNIDRRGSDIRQNSLLLQAGRRLRPQDVAMLASAGIAQIDVIRRPRVQIVVTGDELVTAGHLRDGHQIFETNSALLRGLVARDGGVLEAQCHVADHPEAIRRSLLTPAIDVLLISGGSGIGRQDYAAPLLTQEGELAIHGLALRPAGSTGMGRIGSTLVFLLPGNPAACLCAYDCLAGRALRLLGGRSADWPYPRQQLTVARKIVSEIGYVDYSRVRVVDGQIEPIASGGVSTLSSTTRADGFVIVAAGSEGYPPGSVATVHLYDPII